MPDITDHEAILLLSQKFDSMEKMVREMKVGIDKYHIDNKADMISLGEDIKNNYTGRIEKVENTVEEIGNRTKVLEDASFFFKGAGVLVGVLATLIVYIYLNNQDLIKKELQNHIAQTVAVIK